MWLRLSAWTCFWMVSRITPVVAHSNTPSGLKVTTNGRCALDLKALECEKVATTQGIFFGLLRTSNSGTAFYAGPSCLYFTGIDALYFNPVNTSRSCGFQGVHCLCASTLPSPPSPSIPSTPVTSTPPAVNVRNSSQFAYSGPLQEPSLQDPSVSIPPSLVTAVSITMILLLIGCVFVMVERSSQEASVAKY